MEGTDQEFELERGVANIRQQVENRIQLYCTRYEQGRDLWSGACLQCGKCDCGCHKDYAFDYNGYNGQFKPFVGFTPTILEEPEMALRLLEGPTDEELEEEDFDD